ncbi:hypothetical protein HPULCUR_010614 [Helicostylum pulchrum]|uniref:RING-type E3 ubiquitin transferase n=1 Tax=Helicostylum pulchrum TaxID=562976 RepID=A0ABP9YDV6_9FUNG
MPDHGLVYVSTVYLDTDIDNYAFTFSGTDNGIVSMTNTVGFDLNRFRFYLELSNRYQALGSSEDNINADDIVEKYKDNKHLNLPKSHKHFPVTNNFAWNQYVKENFDNNAKTVVEKNASTSSDEKPVREIAGRPPLTQLRKIGASACIYILIILVGIAGVVQCIKSIGAGILSLKLSPISVVPVDIIMLQVIVPAFTKSFKPTKEQLSA